MQHSVIPALRRGNLDEFSTDARTRGAVPVSAAQLTPDFGAEHSVIPAASAGMTEKEIRRLWRHAL